MYGRSGFKTFIFDDYQLVAKAKLTTDDTGLEYIRDYFEQDFEKLAEYDRKISPYDRNHLLERAFKGSLILYENQRLTQSQIKPFFLKTSKTFVSLDRAGNINGYISCRKIDCGHSLQPFYADQPETAEKLLRKVILEIITTK